MPQISVIVPVYNVEAYLPLCLQTIREQSLSDIEIICINDGATDQSLALLKLFAAVDNRIRIIDKPNGGLSSARNAGIMVARAECIMLVDSDDLLEKNACEAVYKAFIENDADIVTFGANCYPSSEVDEWLTDCLGPRDIVYDAFSIEILTHEKSHPFACRSAFSVQFLKEKALLFDEIVRFGEDEVFYFAAYPRAQKTVLLSNRLYNYRIMREDSLMSSRSADTLAKAKDHIVIIDRVLSDWKEQGWIDQYPAQIFNWALDFVVGRIRNESATDQLELLKRLRTVLNKSLSWDIITDSRVPCNIQELLAHLINENTLTVSARLYSNWRFSNSMGQKIAYVGKRLVDKGKTTVHRAFSRFPRGNARHLRELEIQREIRQREDARAEKALLDLRAEYHEKEQSNSLCPVSTENASRKFLDANPS